MSAPSGSGPGTVIAILNNIPALPLRVTLSVVVTLIPLEIDVVLRGNAGAIDTNIRIMQVNSDFKLMI